MLKQLDDIYQPIAQWISQQKQQQPLVVAVTGAQGAGKSTFCYALKPILEKKYHFKSVILSLDDFYLTKAERLMRAKKIHPLFATRGVPGTHDVALGISIIHALINLKSHQSIQIPRFSKLKDDRLTKSDWQTVNGPIDIILFEGWCLAAKPQPNNLLIKSINNLEQKEDQDGIWRMQVNQFLREDYQRLFEMIDKLIMIKIPSFDLVFQHRLLQEKELARHSHSQPSMSPEELQRFIQHYERITKQMLIDVPEYADIVLAVDQDHQFSFLKK